MHSQFPNFQTFTGSIFTAMDVMPIVQDKDFHIVSMIVTAMPDPTSPPTQPFSIEFCEGGFSAPGTRQKLVGSNGLLGQSKIEFNSPMCPLVIQKGFPASIRAYMPASPVYSQMNDAQYSITGYWD